MLGSCLEKVGVYSVLPIQFLIIFAGILEYPQKLFHILNYSFWLFVNET